MSRPRGNVGPASGRKYVPSPNDKPKFHVSFGRKPKRLLTLGSLKPISVTFHDSGREESEEFFTSAA
jgi:hypothetical protein